MWENQEKVDRKYLGQGGLTEQAATEHSSDGGRVPISGEEHSRERKGQVQKL